MHPFFDSTRNHTIFKYDRVLFRDNGLIREGIVMRQAMAPDYSGELVPSVTIRCEQRDFLRNSGDCAVILTFLSDKFVPHWYAPDVFPVVIGSKIITWSVKWRQYVILSVVGIDGTKVIVSHEEHEFEIDLRMVYVKYTGAEVM